VEEINENYSLRLFALNNGSLAPSISGTL